MSRRTPKKNYQGRQLYELLQNADDASDKESREEKVYIELKGNLLIIKNTGEPFSEEEGVESLMYASTSPKSMQRKKIGQKGLGFRAILNWASRLEIVAEAFWVEFDKRHAVEEYQRIITEKPQIAIDMKALTIDKEPVAILSFPKILPKDSSRLESTYATAIVFYCEEEHLKSIKEQLETFSFEELIFLRHLREIEIKTANGHKKIESYEEEGQIVIVEQNLNTKEEIFTTWRLYKEFGKIEAHDSNKEDKQQNYEFIIAYNEDEEAQKRQREEGVLYSFFKTDIAMRFPFLVHATLDLSTDRNNLQKESKFNIELIDRLVAFIGKTAVSLAKKPVSYEPLKMLTAKSELNPVLDSSKFKFSEKIKDSLETLQIYPSISGEYVTQEEARYASEDFNVKRELSKPF
jgi:hypothetical protein